MFVVFLKDLLSILKTSKQVLWTPYLGASKHLQTSSNQQNNPPPPPPVLNPPSPLPRPGLPSPAYPPTAPGYLGLSWETYSSDDRKASGRSFRLRSCLVNRSSFPCFVFHVFFLSDHFLGGVFFGIASARRGELKVTKHHQTESLRKKSLKIKPFNLNKKHVEPFRNSHSLYWPQATGSKFLKKRRRLFWR